MSAHVPDQDSGQGAGDRERLLAIYLNDHLAGAVAGVRRVRRMARTVGDTGLAAELRGLADDIASDQRELEGVIDRLGVRVQQYKRYLAAAAELAGTLKSNGRLVTRSPLSTLTELEMMRLGIEGKASGWRTLRQLADHDERLSAGRLDELEARAEEQARRVEKLRVRTAAALFGPSARR